MMATVTRTELTSARPIPRTLPDLHQSHHYLVVSSSPPPWRSPAGPRARARPIRTNCYGRSDCASPTLRSTCWSGPFPLRANSKDELPEPEQHECAVQALALDPGSARLHVGTRDAHSHVHVHVYICQPGTFTFTFICQTLLYSTVDTSIIILISSPSSLPDLT